MVGWLYIDELVAAPIRLLESDRQTGVVTIEVGAKFVTRRSMLRGRIVVEYRGWDTRREVRCMGAEEVGPALMIEAIDVGPATLTPQEDAPALGPAEDWLIVNGKACCQVRGLSIGERHDAVIAHCQFHVALDAWRDLRIGAGAPLASLGIQPHQGESSDGSITPLLHAARELGLGEEPPRVEVVRLRERVRLSIDPIATDWGESSTLVIGRVYNTAPLSEKRVASAYLEA